jgi:hypothetical protein
LALLFALAVLGGPGAARAEMPRRASTITVHGWSTDSRWVAYTRFRGGRERPDERMHRRVEGGAFRGFGEHVGGDVAAYATRRGYVVRTMTKEVLDASRIRFRDGAREFVVTFAVGKAIGWRLTRDGVALAHHAFDRPYLAFDVDAFPSPDGRQALLVMALDTGWEVDAAAFPVALGAADPLPP